MNAENKGTFLFNLKRLATESINLPTQLRRDFAFHFLNSNELMRVWTTHGIDEDVDELALLFQSARKARSASGFTPLTPPRAQQQAGPSPRVGSFFSGVPTNTKESTQGSVGGKNIFSFGGKITAQSNTPLGGQSRVTGTRLNTMSERPNAAPEGLFLMRRDPSPAQPDTSKRTTLLSEQASATAPHFGMGGTSTFKGMFQMRPQGRSHSPLSQDFEGEEMLPHGEDPRKSTETLLANLSSQSLKNPDTSLPPPDAGAQLSPELMASIKTLQDTAINLSEEANKNEAPIKAKFKEVVVRNRDALHAKLTEVVQNMQGYFQNNPDLAHPWAGPFEQQTMEMEHLMNSMGAELLSTFDELFDDTTKGLFRLETAVKTMANEILPAEAVEEGGSPELLSDQDILAAEGGDAPVPGEPDGPGTGAPKGPRFTGTKRGSVPGTNLNYRPRLPSGGLSRARTEAGIRRALMRAAGLATDLAPQPNKKARTSANTTEKNTPGGAGPAAKNTPRGAAPAAKNTPGGAGPPAKNTDGDIGPTPTSPPEGAGPVSTTTTSGGAAVDMLGDFDF